MKNVHKDQKPLGEVMTLNMNKLHLIFIMRNDLLQNHTKGE